MPRSKANPEFDIDEYNVDWLMGEIAATSAAASRSQADPTRTALVLAGGGLTGAVYEIGALRAIDDLLVDREAQDFDVFIGTSAGALVAALLAAGVTPCDMFRALAHNHPLVDGPRPGHLFAVNWRDYARRGWRLPRVLANTACHAVRNPNDVNLFDFVFAMAGALPPGIYDPAGIERFMTLALDYAGGYKTFADFPRELHVIATELDTGQRCVFSRETTPHVSVARAVSASCALPVLYQPVEIDGVDYVDGGLRGTASLDVAIEHGASLVVCINPIVPLTPEHRGRRHVSRQGISAVASQSFRTLAHSSLTYQIKQIKRRHPRVDFILIEPRPDDEGLYVDNIMRYSSRLSVAQRGFESVTLDLAKDYPRYKAILASHGIPISRRVVAKTLQALQDSAHDPRAVQRMLETSSHCPDPNGTDALSFQLDNTLIKLERILDRTIARRAIS